MGRSRPPILNIGVCLVAILVIREEARYLSSFRRPALVNASCGIGGVRFFSSNPRSWEHDSNTPEFFANNSRD